jgi:hypothetical protein
MTAIAVILKPFVALILLGCIVLPLKMLFVRFYPNGKIKSFLLRDLEKAYRGGDRG